MRLLTRGATLGGLIMLMAAGTFVFCGAMVARAAMRYLER